MMGDRYPNDLLLLFEHVFTLDKAWNLKTTGAASKTQAKTGTSLSSFRTVTEDFLAKNSNSQVQVLLDRRLTLVQTVKRPVITNLSTIIKYGGGACSGRTGERTDVAHLCAT